MSFGLWLEAWNAISARRSATNLESRLKKLEETGYDVTLLRLIEQLVTRHGFVEFRPRIDSLASRLEDNNLEVALFGRVSSGKSSLLNALLSTDVLPVGINPITAVPTRLLYGPTLCATVAYGNGREETVTVEELGKLVTEQGNPGNLRNVARAVVEVPSPRLRAGHRAGRYAWAWLSGQTRRSGNPGLSSFLRPCAASD